MIRFCVPTSCSCVSGISESAGDFASVSAIALKVAVVTLPGPIEKVNLTAASSLGNSGNPHSLKLSHGQVPSEFPPPSRGFFGSIQSGRTFFSLGDFLMGVMKKASQSVAQGVSSYSTAEHIPGFRL